MRNGMLEHGEGPLPIVAASSPADCFNTVLEAARIAVEHMTPVIILTDGYIANGSEPWRFPAAADLKQIKVNFTTENNNPGGTFMPYKARRKTAPVEQKPGTKELMHRIGGLEKQNETGNVSYDAKNHEQMTKLRADKIQKIADYIPDIKPDSGKESGKMLVLGWGSTSGAIKTAVRELIAEGYDVCARSPASP